MVRKLGKLFIVVPNLVRDCGSKDDSGKETLLSISKWDLNWQRDFTFERPKVFTKEEAEKNSYTITCRYDNPTARTVVGGYGSDDEMCFNFTYLSFVPR